MKKTPSPNGPNGRDRRGRFTKGNGGGPGQRVAKLREALLRAVTPVDMAAMVKKLITMAKGGDVPAAKLVIERVLGPAMPADILERIEALENLAESENEKP